MSWFSGITTSVGNVFKGKTPAELQTEKETELAKLSASYDEKISSAKAKETAAAPAAVGTTSAVGRGRKTKRAKKTKSKRSRSGRKSSRL
jgi:hypothetical protein